MKKNSLVVQANQLIEAKYKLSVEEQKIIRILVSHIKREDEDFRDYEFHVKELAELLEMEHKDPYGVLREITKKLISKVLEFQNPETNTLLQVSWLASAKYKKGQGTVLMSFHPALRPFLLQLQSFFTKYELGQILQFKGQYAIRFFELRKSFLGRGKKEVFYSLKELWELFKLEKNEYKQFFDFKRRVLEPARLELLEKTGKSFSWEAVKRGRGGKVVGVKFVFEGESEKEERGEIEAITESQREEVKVLEYDPVTKVEPEAVQLELNEGMQLLLDYGISESVAFQLGQEHTLAYLREKIALANLHPEYIKNKAGFLVRAIKENWTDENILREEKTRMRSDALKATEETRKRVQGIWDRYRMQKGSRGLQAYEKLKEAEKENVKKAFLESVNDVIRSIYRKKPDFGYEDGMFRSFFLSTLQLPSFESFLAAEGITLTGEEWEMLEKL